MFELAVGNAPFEGNTSEQETFRKIIDSNFEMPESISDELKSLILESLVKNPK